MKLNKRGFTFIEFLVVVGIFGILAAIIIPQFTNSQEREQAEKNKEVQMRQKIEVVLGGNHVLRKMVERTTSEGYLEGSFFLFAGTMSGESKLSTSTVFAWLMNDGKTYQISEMPLTKVRVTHENVEVPKIKFIWSRKPFSDGEYYLEKDNIQKALDRLVDYVVITCKESDWKPNIRLPLS